VGMPTVRPRHQVTETPAVAQAIDVAARRWPNEPRSRLLLRLVHAGSIALEQGEEVVRRDRRAAIAATAGKYADAYDPGYLDNLRRDWPE